MKKNWDHLKKKGERQDDLSFADLFIIVLEIILAMIKKLMLQA